MLSTNLKHIETDEQFRAALEDNENLMVCCGRMGPMCIPVYDIMEKLGPKYPHVAFRDMAFDSTVANHVRSLPEVRGYNSLPFTVYFHKGRVVAATGGIQNKREVTAKLEQSFAGVEHSAAAAV